MTPKEKAKELFNEFLKNQLISFRLSHPNLAKELAKQCALIAVDLAIQYNDFHIEFLQEVKQEIEKL